MAEADIAQAFFDLIEMGDFENYSELFADDVRINVPGARELDKQQAIQLSEATFRAFPDIRFKDRVLSDRGGGIIHVTYRITGTHLGTFDLSAFGLPPIEATGTKMALPHEEVTMQISGHRISNYSVRPVDGGGMSGILASIGHPITII